MVPKEPGWPRNSGAQNVLVGGLARGLGTSSAAICVSRSMETAPLQGVKNGPEGVQRSPAGLVTPVARILLWGAWRADLGPRDPGSWGSWEILGSLGSWGLGRSLRSWGLGSLGSLGPWEILGPGKPGTPGILGDHLGDPRMTGRRSRGLYIQLPIHRPWRPLC